MWQGVRLRRGGGHSCLVAGMAVRGLTWCCGRLQALLLQPEDAALRAESEVVNRIAAQLQAASTALEKQQWAAAEQHAAVACRMQIPAVEEALRLKCEALLGRGRAAQAVSESRGLTRGGDAYAPEVTATAFRNARFK